MLSILIIVIVIIEAYAINICFNPLLKLPDCCCFFFELGADATGFFFFQNLNITIKTSTLDYNGERYLSYIINCVIFRL
jgi:hypothetical protein